MDPIGAEAWIIRWSYVDALAASIPSPGLVRTYAAMVLAM